MEETLGFSKKIKVEIDGAPALNGELPVTRDVSINEVDQTSNFPVNISGQEVYVAPGYLRTRHKFDQNKVTEKVNSDYKIFKTFSVSNKFLKEIIFSVSRKEIFFKVEVDGELVSEANIDGLYSSFSEVSGRDVSGSFSVYRNSGGDYGVSLKYDNNKVNNVISISLRSSGGSTDNKNIIMEAIAYIYSERLGG